MKDQFQSNEILRIRLTPFVNKTTGDYVTTGLDTCTLTIKKPDGSLLTGGPHLATWDTDVHMWTFDVAVLSYMQGEWKVKAVSNDVDSLPKWACYTWGDYVDDFTTIKNKTNNLPASPANEVTSTAINTKLGTPAGASVSADIAAVQTTASSANTNASAAATSAASAATSAAAASSAASSAAAEATTTRKIQANRWKVQGTQLIVYQDDQSSVFKTFDLKDENGLPSATRIYERVPV